MANEKLDLAGADRENKEQPVVVGVLLEKVRNNSWNVGERICVKPKVAEQGVAKGAFKPYSHPVFPSLVKKAGGLDAYFKANPKMVLAEQPPKLEQVEPKAPKAERKEK